MIPLAQGNILKLVKLTVLVLALVFFLFDLFPLIKGISDCYGRIRMARAAVRTLTKEDKAVLQKKLETELAGLEAGFQKMQAAKTEAQSKMTREVSVPVVTLMIEDLASSQEIELRLIKPLQPQVQGKYQMIPIALEFRCDYARLVRFLSQFETLEVPVSVQSLSIHENLLSYPQLDMKLTIFVLFAEG
ncbi:MAG: type 4a pilus biogenesis protein PilO [Candidatus Omnitrophota bacterium]|nr:type 4a pilus biogenesis protein PilO [Candidatus Omnitrophota bacterium]MDZ4241932.1 type 4a pilus biogenesis protein PilO [Candidatus Omnitrophota bacterium]